jgi:hypothetical protein
VKPYLFLSAAIGAALFTAAPAQPQFPSPAPKQVAIARPLPLGANEPVTEGEGRAIAEKLAEELTDNFVYADDGKRYAETLRANAKAGRYDIGTRQDLAERMTDDLQMVQKDGHLHVAVAENERDQLEGGAVGIPKHWPPLIQSAKWIAPGIAYIRFTAFLSTDEEVAAVRSFMREHREAKTFIFDLRNHHGGQLGEMDEIFPYLFSEKTPLAIMEMRRSVADREGPPFGQSPTQELAKDDNYVRATHYALPNEATPARDAKVYLLTSNRTASAGEHFSLAMKSTGRATLIGEATAGANHFGGMTEIGEHFEAFVPVGRTFDTKTGKDWEGDGIAPDIAVDPRQALVIALEKAGLSHDEAVRLDATEIPAEPVHRDKRQAR